VVVVQPPVTYTHPRDLVRAACAALGTDVFVDWCLALLTGRISSRQACDDPSLPDLAWLGGRSVAAGSGWSPAEPPNDYWVRVWAARAFLYVWRDDVPGALVEALDDPAWRVRHDVARVVAARGVGEAVPHLLPLLEHRLPRVRVVALRAIGAAGESEHAAAAAELRADEDPAVRAAAERALERLSSRLDRTVTDLLDD
jgi:hypothetical protein